MKNKTCENAICLFLLLYLLWISPAMSGSSESADMVFDQGRFSWAEMEGARFHPPDRLLGPGWEMINRVTRRNEYDTFEKEIEKN